MKLIKRMFPMNEVTDKERIENELLETNEHWSRLYPRLLAVIEREKRLERALRRLEDAADPFLADQSNAVDTRRGLVQPVDVEECEELTAAVLNAREALADERE